MYKPDDKAAASAEGATGADASAGKDVDVKPATAVASGFAAPLTDMLVYSVESTNGGVEHIRRGQYATDLQHTGPKLRVTVIEIGIGNKPVATISGNSVSVHETVTVWVDYDGHIRWPCPVGHIIDGYKLEYNLDGQKPGMFTYQNTSANFPYTTLKTSIRIRQE
jgi:hypothetical protein